LERDRLQNSRKEAWGREAQLRKKCEGLQAELRARKAVRDASDEHSGIALLNKALLPRTCPEPRP
jgi:hypothetical protein